MGECDRFAPQFTVCSGTWAVLLHRPVNRDPGNNDILHVHFVQRGSQTTVHCEKCLGYRTEASGIIHKAVCEHTQTEKQLYTCQYNLLPSSFYQKTKPSLIRLWLTNLTSLQNRGYLQACLKTPEVDHLLKAGVVPGVLENFDVKRVLNFASTAHTITVICTCKKSQYRIKMELI